MRLGGNSILITGGGTGIGLGLAEAFLARGSRVAICGRRPEKLAAARSRHPELLTQVCDVSDGASRHSLLEALEREGFETNVLINNAARMTPFRLDEPNPACSARMREDVEINLLAPMELVALLLPELRARAGAAIVNVSSPVGLVPAVGVPIYSASKAALHAYTVSLRRQLEAEVEVIELYPPSVDTEMTEGVDRGKMSVERFVADVMPRLERGEREIWSGEGRVLPWLNRLLPRRTFELVNRSAKPR